MHSSLPAGQTLFRAQGGWICPTRLRTAGSLQYDPGKYPIGRKTEMINSGSVREIIETHAMGCDLEWI